MCVLCILDFFRKKIVIDRKHEKEKKADAKDVVSASIRINLMMITEQFTSKIMYKCEKNYRNQTYSKGNGIANA